MPKYVLLSSRRGVGSNFIRMILPNTVYGVKNLDHKFNNMVFTQIKLITTLMSVIEVTELRKSKRT